VPADCGGTITSLAQSGQTVLAVAGRRLSEGLGSTLAHAICNSTCGYGMCARMQDAASPDIRSTIKPAGSMARIIPAASPNQTPVLSGSPSTKAWRYGGPSVMTSRSSSSSRPCHRLVNALRRTRAVKPRGHGIRRAMSGTVVRMVPSPSVSRMAS
jgi:hypothetical protein